MGFCFYNNIAITAAYLKQHSYKRIAILDIDNHHGNGTQDIFANDPDILYTSLHGHPNVTFPGTGYTSEVGLGDGEGTTVNIPLPVATTDDDYLFAFDSIMSPIVKQFNPEILLVSLGLDSLSGDPYGNLGLSVEIFYALGARIGLLAQMLCNNRVAVFLEGGYNFTDMGRATSLFFKGLLKPENYEKTSLTPRKVIQEIVFNVRSVHRNFWYGL
jgi:acetoin utilization deacetylase AcuC-like enzyme